jgi:hypothetical protein
MPLASEFMRTTLWRLALRTLELVIVDHSTPVRCLGTYPNCGPVAIPAPLEIKNRVLQITV